MHRTALGALVLLLLAVPPAAGHATGGPVLSHVSVKLVTLAPGENQTIPIATGEGPWLHDMVFIVHQVFLNASRNLRLDLVYEHAQHLATWTLNQEKNQVSARIPFDGGDGDYQLLFTNEAPTQTRFFFYFDQTCNCVVKPVPTDDGWVVYHYDLKKDHNFLIGFPLVEGWTVRGVVTTLTNPRGQYPEDFRVLRDATASGPDWLNLTFKAPDERVYVFLYALEGSPDFPDPDTYVELQAVVDDKGAAKSPSLAGALAIAVVTVLAVALRRRA